MTMLHYVQILLAYLQSFWEPILLTIVLPIGIQILSKWLARKRWGEGAASFAGRAYIALLKKRASDETSPLASLIAEVVIEEGAAFAKEYAGTARVLGAREPQAVLDAAMSRLEGQLGHVLATDPTIAPAKPAPVAALDHGADWVAHYGTAPAPT